MDEETGEGDDADDAGDAGDAPHAAPSSAAGAGPVVRASAPGKVILFGEHAVVFGRTAVAMAVNLDTRVQLRRVAGPQHLVNGRALSTRQHTFIEQAIQVAGLQERVSIETSSRVPSASGMGSSAALTVATTAALLQHTRGRWTQEDCARAAYEAEWKGQGGRGSPTDTSTVTHGRAVLVASKPRGDLLWRIERGPRSWFVHHVPPPELPIVVAFSHQKGRTAREVAKVARVVERAPAGPAIIEELGRIADAGVDALKARDHDAVARLMNQAHEHLTMLGVSTQRLNELVRAARAAGATGAKLTGAGGGGCIIAVGGVPAKVRAALSAAGARAWVVRPHAAGARAWGGPLEKPA